MRMRRTVALLTIGLFSLMGAAPSSGVVSASTGPVVVGAAAASAASSGLIGPASQSQMIAASVGFMTNRSLLDQFLQAIYTPSSPEYHQFLSSRQFSYYFAPSALVYGEAVSYFSSFGIQTYTDASRLFVNLDGTVAQFDQAFSTSIDVFHDGKVGAFYANVNSLYLPASFGTFVTAAVGLENYTYYYLPEAAVAPSPPGCTPSAGSIQTPCMTIPNPTECGSPIPNGSVEASLWLVPEQVQGAYNETSLICGGHNGSGQTIALIDAGYGDRTIQTDIAEFSAEFGLPIPVVSTATINASNTVADITGQFTCNSIGSTNCITGEVPVTDVQGAAPAVGWDGETALDVEWSHAMAPGADLVSMVSFDAGAGLDMAVATAIAGHYGNIISQSFGQCECANSTYLGGPASGSDQSYTDPFYQMAAATGITVLASSGDWGSNASPNGSTCITDVNWPASDPYVTGVGGTVLTVTGTTWAGEGAWQGYSCLANNGGSGGGYSALSRPSYQYETNLYPNSLNQSQNQLDHPELVGAAPVWPAGVNPNAFSSRRGVPDVAAVGGSGVWIYCNECVTQSPVFGTLGTSLSSPAYAGMIAVMESALTNTKYSTFGLFNPLAYQILNSPSYGSVTHQITSYAVSPYGNGNNMGPPAEYQPGPGWDPVTGIGTPNVGLLVECLEGTHGLDCNPGPASAPPSGVTITQPTYGETVNTVSTPTLSVAGTESLSPGNFQVGQPNTAPGNTGEQESSLDILQAWFSDYRTLATGQSAFTVNIRVQNLSDITTPPTGALGEHWEIKWTYGGATNYAEMLLWYQGVVSASAGGTGVAGLFFYAGNITTGTTGTTVNQNAVNGTYTATAPGLITITVPTSDVSKPTLGSVLTSASADTQEFVGTPAFWLQFTVKQALDPSSFTCALGSPLQPDGYVQVALNSQFGGAVNATLVNFPSSNQWAASLNLAGLPSASYDVYARQVVGGTAGPSTFVPINVVAPSASKATLMVASDYQGYKPGKSVSVLGTLTTSAGQPLGGWQVGIEVDGPDGFPLFLDQVTTQPNGQYGTSFQLPTSAPAGTYVLRAAVWGLTASTNFGVASQGPTLHGRSSGSAAGTVYAAPGSIGVSGVHILNSTGQAQITFSSGQEVQAQVTLTDFGSTAQTIFVPIEFLNQSGAPVFISSQTVTVGAGQTMTVTIDATIGTTFPHARGTYFVLGLGWNGLISTVGNAWNGFFTGASGTFQVK